MEETSEKKGGKGMGEAEVLRRQRGMIKRKKEGSDSDTCRCQGNMLVSPLLVSLFPA